MNNDITIVETLAVVVLGMATVFAVLLLLWVCIAIESKVVAAMQEKQAAAEPAPAAAPAAPAPAATPAPLAKGSCGPVMLHDVPDRTAAMVMAIVADELKTPLNELRFISIKEVK
jgi:Na+-transporting methylmalonyl-CoA/oxaloacetate decarboxylase gamma subunit